MAAEKTGRRQKVASGHVGSVFWKMRSGTKDSTSVVVVSEQCQAENDAVPALDSARGRHPNRPQVSSIYPVEYRRHHLSRHSGLEIVSVSRGASASLGWQSGGCCGGGCPHVENRRWEESSDSAVGWASAF